MYIHNHVQPYQYTPFCRHLTTIFLPLNDRTIWRTKETRESSNDKIKYIIYDIINLVMKKNVNENFIWEREVLHF